MITSRLHCRKTRLITRNLKMDLQTEGRLVTRTRSQFKILDRLIIVYNSDSQSQTLENPIQQETQTDLSQINQSTDILNTQINSQVSEH